MCVWSMIIDHHDNKHKTMKILLTPSRWEKLGAITKSVNVNMNIWRNFSFLYRIWTIYGVLSKFMPFLFRIYVKKNLKK